MKVFAVPQAEREKYYAGVPSVWREQGPMYELVVPTALELFYYSGEVLTKSAAEVLVICIALTELMVKTLLCFVL